MMSSLAVTSASKQEGADVPPLRTIADLEDILPPARRGVLQAAVPLHASTANPNEARAPSVRFFRSTSVRNQFVIQFSERDPILGNALEKECLQMGVSSGVLHASCSPPNVMEPRILLLLTLAKGFDVRKVMRQCIARLRAKNCAMHESYLTHLEKGKQQQQRAGERLDHHNQANEQADVVVAAAATAPKRAKLSK
jgi:hypothetical protein